MIIVELKGGLGNQLFQYALGRRLSLMNNLTLKLDTSWFNENADRQYGLNRFMVDEHFATSEECKSLKKNSIFNIIAKIKEITNPYYLRSYIKEKSIDFDSNLLLVNQSCYISGYWQSEKYFQDIKDIIKNEFKIKFDMDELNKKYAKQILSSNSVAIHVRRGDYILNSKASEVHGTCSLEYYKKAIKYIVSKVDSPHFFVFSDDPEWTKKNLLINYPTTYLTHNGSEKSYEDLRLMSLCNHFIIANSSFSWWGAWLSSADNKIVLAPSKWFSNLEYNDSDRLPSSWIRL